MLQFKCFLDSYPWYQTLTTSPGVNITSFLGLVSKAENSLSIYNFTVCGQGTTESDKPGIVTCFFKLVYQRRAHVKTTCQLTVAAVLLAIA